MEGSQIAKGRPRKTIKKDFEINELDIEIWYMTEYYIVVWSL